jgi:hypothetical protein
MKIVAYIEAFKKFLDDISEIDKGPVTIELSGPIHLKVTASDGTVLLDTILQIDLPQNG